jgi:hypothetical protein
VLVVDGGPSRRVGPSGVVIGRQPDCDIVAGDPRASRRHALVRLTAEGAEVVPLGRAAIELNGTVCASARALADGDRLSVPGLELAVEIAAQRPDPDDSAARFVLVRAGARFGVVHTPFVIGGGDDDDLIVKRWPARGVVLHVAQDALYVEVGSGKATHNGAPIERGALVQLFSGDELGYRGEVFRIASGGGRVITTDASSPITTPIAVAIEMLPRGGRVVFTLADGDHAVYLADRRFDLLVALLRPPAGYRAGEPIPDDVVRSVVWPRKPNVSRNEINMLISRCRRDLVEAGLAGPRLLERTPGGGATRIVLGPRTEIRVKS